MAYIIFKILALRGYNLNGTVDVSDSLTLRIENNQMHVNNRFIDLLSILMNIENARTQMRLRLGLIPYRILKMEMSPNGRLAVEIEATRFEHIIVLSDVENRFSLKQFSRVPLSQYSGSLKVSSDQIRIIWSNDSLRAAIYLGNDLVSVIDFKTKQFLKSNLDVAEQNSLTKYFDARIEKGVGQSLEINSHMWVLCSMWLY
ncbi:hypothetical protein D3C75_486790 [compost metagenome]